MSLLSLTLLLLSGCPQSPTEDPSSSSGAVTDGATDGSEAPAKAKTRASDLPGGEASGPPPETSPGAPPSDVKFEVEGEGVSLEGTLVYRGDEEGTLRLDILVLEENRPPQLAHTQTVGADGGFSITAPPNYGAVYGVGFIDVDDDGPSPSDPAGMTEIAIGDADVTGIEIALSDEPDLGPLTPGDAGGAEPPEIPEAVDPPPDEEPPPPLEEIEGAPPVDGEAPAEGAAEDAPPSDGDEPATE